MKVKTTDGVLTRDILEWHVPEEVLAVLLKDRSTGRNLIWATNDYARKLRRLLEYPQFLPSKNNERPCFIG